MSVGAVKVTPAFVPVRRGDNAAPARAISVDRLGTAVLTALASQHITAGRSVTGGTAAAVSYSTSINAETQTLRASYTQTVPRTCPSKAASSTAQ